jgi:multisubunit Na+/H+ antiporter MnhE subunit
VGGLWLLMLGWFDGWLLLLGWMLGWSLGWMLGWSLGWFDGWLLMLGWLLGWLLMMGWFDGTSVAQVMRNVAEYNDPVQPPLVSVIVNVQAPVAALLYNPLSFTKPVPPSD